MQPMNPDTKCGLRRMPPEAAFGGRLQHDVKYQRKEFKICFNETWVTMIKHMKLFVRKNETHNVFPFN